MQVVAAAVAIVYDNSHKLPRSTTYCITNTLNASVVSRNSLFSVLLPVAFYLLFLLLLLPKMLGRRVWEWCNCWFDRLQLLAISTSTKIVFLYRSKATRPTRASRVFFCCTPGTALNATKQPSLLPCQSPKLLLRTTLKKLQISGVKITTWYSFYLEIHLFQHCAQLLPY